MRLTIKLAFTFSIIFSITGSLGYIAYDGILKIERQRLAGEFTLRGELNSNDFQVAALRAFNQNDQKILQTAHEEAAIAIDRFNSAMTLTTRADYKEIIRSAITLVERADSDVNKLFHLKREQVTTTERTNELAKKLNDGLLELEKHLFTTKTFHLGELEELNNIRQQVNSRHSVAEQLNKSTINHSVQSSDKEWQANIEKSVIILKKYEIKYPEYKDHIVLLRNALPQYKKEVANRVKTNVELSHLQSKQTEDFSAILKKKKKYEDKCLFKQPQWLTVSKKSYCYVSVER